MKKVNRGFEPERVIAVKKTCRWQVFRRSARRGYAPSAGSFAQQRFPNPSLSARKIRKLKGLRIFSFETKHMNDIYENIPRR
ncbi:hypothetical protein [Allofournierella sp. CML151]|uniref:hypothetical protein n=1 Tax=Allofournierella sp. CML151 TaxID=2998082 RepID=UPI0022EA854C|nr:hypothetical protein [Fournierella sp. CML151]